MFQQISVDKLIPHKDNPRKDLGDLQELTDSIRINGIFQNLTVVPAPNMEGLYTVIIGHRRLQAAKDAGLETVPCAVVEMDAKKQASTMLLENIQRSDLTMYEQAQGIQMCLDLGMTEADISTKTGFSKSTVKRRVKLLDLDQDEFKLARNASLDDYILLDQIEDVDVKNSLLKYIGTNEFNFKVEQAKLKQTSVDTELSESAYEEDNSVDTESSSQVNEDNIPTDPYKDTRIIAKNLRITAMKQIFRQKIEGKQVSEAVLHLITGIFFEDSFDRDLFNSIANEADLSDYDLIANIIKHRTNYLIVMVYSMLEKRNLLEEIYDFMKLFDYKLSEEEEELLKHG